MAEQKSDTSKLGIAIGAMAAVALVVAAGIYLLQAKGEVRAPEGFELTDGDKAAVMQIFSTLETADNLGASDPDAGIRKALEAIEKIEALDGWQMECGAVFRKESTPLISAYLRLAALHDRIMDCESAEKYRGEFLRLAETDYVVFPMRFVGPMTVMTGGESYYESAKKRTNEMLAMNLEDSMKNCLAGEAGKEETPGGGERAAPAAEKQPGE